MYLEVDEALSPTSLGSKVPLSRFQNPEGTHRPGSRDKDVRVTTWGFHQTPRGQQGAGLFTCGWQGAPRWSLVVVGRGGLFSEPSWSRCSRVPSPCSCSFCFFFSSLRSLTLRSLALPMPPAWRMDSNRVARPLEGSTTSLGAPWTGSGGGEGRLLRQG